jgi:hypothetical protein
LLSGTVRIHEKSTAHLVSRFWIDAAGFSALNICGNKQVITQRIKRSQLQKKTIKPTSKPKVQPTSKPIVALPTTGRLDISYIVGKDLAPGYYEQYQVDDTKQCGYSIVHSDTKKVE